MYRDLIFDLYGTLVDIRTVEDLAAWKKVRLFYGWQGAACSAAQLRAAYRRELEKRRKGPYCEVRTELIFAGLFRQLEVKKNALALGNEAARIFRIASTRARVCASRERNGSFPNRCRLYQSPQLKCSWTIISGRGTPRRMSSSYTTTGAVSHDRTIA